MKSSFDPQNILVLDFGQLGDVVMSLPALRAIRERFPQARITVAVGLTGGPIVEMSGFANQTIVVDRVALRDGSKPVSILRIIRIVKDVRRAQFDFVIDLHSLSETNLLGFASGAKTRLYARRPGRSLDFLSNFRPRPPIEDNRPSKHAIDRYLEVLLPLGIRGAPRIPRLTTRDEDDRAIEKILKKEKIAGGIPLVGIFPGAGHPGRRWPLERFKELAEALERNDGVRVALFAGPEERHMIRAARAIFPSTTLFIDRLNIPQLAAALARLAVFVSNDTGPLHIAAAVGTPVVMLIDRPTPNSYVPVEAGHRVVYSNPNGNMDMTADEVYMATRELLVSCRTAALFSK